jgi:signal transduction histidine kinase
MSIVKTIVEAHEGRVSARSEKNKGTTVSFILPRDRENIGPENRTEQIPGRFAPYTH